MDQSTVRLGSCKDCSDWIVILPRGTRRVRCDDCRRQHDRRLDRARTGSSDPCGECGKPRGTKGTKVLCASCYMKQKRAEIKAAGGRPCTVEGCTRRVWNTGRMCEMHAHRWARNGDVGPAGSTQKPRGTTFYKIPEIRARVLAEQGGRCGLCASEIEAKDAHVDHNHACCPPGDFCEKCMRAVLCRACNVGLGMFQDDPEALRKAADYIESFR